MSTRTAPRRTAEPSLLDTDEYRELFALVVTDTPDAAAASAARYASAARELRRRCAVDMRAAGATWAEVGAALGVSLQAAAQLCSEPRRGTAYR